MKVTVSDSHQSIMELLDCNSDEPFSCYTCADTTFDANRLPSLQPSSNNPPRKKRNVKPKVETRFPRLNAKKHLIRILYIIHDGFTLNDRRIIQNALKVVGRCLMNPKNLKDMYQIFGRFDCLFLKEIWKRSLLETHSIDHGYDYLLRYQLMCLKVKSEQDQFPMINIHPIYEKTNVLGRGKLGCVSCKSHGSTVLINGEFHVYLNRYHLGARDGNRTNATFWAGVIVHEMLHNLGHSHDNDYSSNRWQINTFQECFEHNAKYAS